MSNNNIDDILDQISFDDLAQESEMKVDTQKLFEQYRPSEKLPTWKKFLLTVVLQVFVLIVTLFMSFSGTMIFFKYFLIGLLAVSATHNAYVILKLDMCDYSDSIMTFLEKRKKILLFDIRFIQVLKFVGAPAAILLFLYSEFILYPETPWIIVGLHTLALAISFIALYIMNKALKGWYRELEDI